MRMPLLVHLSSSEIMSCKECGQRFATADALRKDKKLGKEEREPQNKRLCHTKDWTSRKDWGKAQNLNRQPR
jgi:ribosome-binding protein aMBF1 (putative translation factor)